MENENNLNTVKAEAKTDAKEERILSLLEEADKIDDKLQSRMTSLTREVYVPFGTS